MHRRRVCKAHKSDTLHSDLHTLVADLSHGRILNKPDSLHCSSTVLLFGFWPRKLLSCDVKMQAAPRREVADSADLEPQLQERASALAQVPHLGVPSLRL